MRLGGRGSTHHESWPVNLHLAMGFTCSSSFATDGQGANLYSSISLFLKGLFHSSTSYKEENYPRDKHTPRAGWGIIESQSVPGRLIWGVIRKSFHLLFRILPGRPGQWPIALEALLSFVTSKPTLTKPVLKKRLKWQRAEINRFFWNPAGFPGDRR